MEVRIEDDISKEEMEKVVDALVKAFEKDELINSVYLDDNRGRRPLIKLTTLYYAHCGHLFVCRDKETKEVVGAAAWANEGYWPLSLFSLLRYPYLLLTFIWLFIIAFPAMMRMLTVSNEIERRRPKKKHAYLYIIGSIRPGAGSLLMKEAQKLYGDKTTLYLECSDPPVNEKFYGKFGFQNVGYMEYKGISEGFMMRPGEGVAITDFFPKKE